MLSNPSVLPYPVLDTFVATATLALFALVGRALAGDRLHGSDALERLASWLVMGMLFVIGLGVTLVYQRAGAHTVIPLILVGTALIARRRLPDLIPSGAAAEPWRIWAAVAGVIIASGLFHAWHCDWLSADGRVRVDHSDYGFYAMLAKALPTAKVSTGWIASAGAAAVEAGESQDQWYHWGPVWLGMLIMKVTGLPALESVFCIGSSVMVVILVLLASALVRAVTNWKLLPSILVGTVSIMAMPYPSALTKMAPFGYVEHARESLLWNFAYYFEATLVLFILLAWLRGRMIPALVMTVCATISSPHFVAGAGIALGTLMLAGLVMRDRALWKPAATGVITILLGWGVMRFGFGANVSSNLSGDEGVGLLSRIGLMATHGPLNALIEFALCLLLLPGWIAFIRLRGDDLSDRARVLGWLAVSGIVGGMMATFLFENVENMHLTDFPCSIIAMPAAIWGLARLACQEAPWLRRTACGLIAACALCGVTTLVTYKRDLVTTSWTLDQMNGLKTALHGEPFGYFTREDRPWWLPKYSFVAALLDSRCIRLNPLIQADIENSHSRAYKTFLPFEMVPYRQGDPLLDWSLKLARALDLQYLLHTGPDPVPEAVAAQCERVFTDHDVILFRIKQKPAPALTSLEPK